MVNKDKNLSTDNNSVNHNNPQLEASLHSYQMREYEDAINVSSAELLKLPASPIQAELLSVRGNSHLQLRNYKEAEDDFLNAQKLASNKQATYLSLYRLYHTISEQKKATDILHLGISNCKENSELQLILTSLESDISITACMIVKNEEKLLPQCLESIRDWVNEIIIVDTGSTDQTIEIAKSYGAKLYEQKWENDFSLHRNFSLSKATSDWILVIDADERVNNSDIALIKQALKESKSGLVALNVINQDPATKQISSAAISVRIFKRELGLTYSGVVHNNLDIPQELDVKQTDATLIHVGYHLEPDQMKLKFNRTMTLLKKQIKSHPDDPFVIYNFIQQLRTEDAHYDGNNQELIFKLVTQIDRLVANREDKHHLGLMANFVSAQFYYDIQDYDNCLSVCQKLVAQEENYPDPWILSGFVYSNISQYEKSAVSFEKYLNALGNYKNSPVTGSLILHYPDSHLVALNNLGIISEMRGDKESAKKIYKQVLAIDPENPNAIDRLESIASENDNSQSEAPSKTNLVDKIDLILLKSRELILSEKGLAALGMLQTLHDRYPFENKKQNIEFNRLLSYAYSFTGDYASAEITISRGRAIDPKSADLYFIESYIKLKMQEYSGSINSAQRFLQLVSQSKNNDIACTKEHISQAHNVMALSLMATAQPEKAENSYREAIELCQTNHLPYLNLFKLLKATGRDKEAASLVNQGLKACSNVTELRLLKSLTKKKQTITACMIVKDEEKLLPGCLDSIRGWIDEIIVVDTGSTDKTKAIAKSYGAKMFDQKWEGNFSKHRNHSIDQASSDWVLIIDADERIQLGDIPKILELISHEKCETISVNVRNVYRENDHKVTGSNSIRFFKRSLNLRYDGIVHNRLVVPETVIVSRAPITFEHLGYDLDENAMHIKFVRTKALLEAQLDEDKDNAFAWFNLAQLLRGQFYKDPAKYGIKIIEAANNAKQLTSPNEHHERFIHLMALNQLAWTHYYMDDFEPALKYSEQVLLLKPNYLDPLILRGHLLTRTADYEGAKKAYSKYLDEQSKYQEHLETDSLILIHLESRAVALASLGAIAEFQEDFDSAIELYEETLKETRSYLQVPLALGRLYLQKGQLDKAELNIAQQLEKEPNLIAAHLLFAILCERKGEAGRAEDHYIYALNLEPENPNILLQYSDYCATHDKLPESVELLEKLQQLNYQSFEIKDRLASQYFALGQFENAKDLYVQLLEQEPNDANLLNDMANCCFKMEQFKEAEELYRKAVEQDDEQSFAHRNLILCLIKLESTEKALFELERYLSHNEQDKQISFIYGQLLFDSAKYSEALAQFELCLRTNQNDPILLCHLADCYLAMGHKDSAEMGYQQALLVDPTCAPARAHLEELNRQPKIEVTQPVKL